MDEELDFLDLFFAFWKKRIWLILAIIIGLGTGYAYTKYAVTPKYTSSVTLILAKSAEEKPESLREFLREHIWHHIVRKHLPGIFGWTFGIMLLFGLLGHYYDLETWVGDNPVWMVLLAVAVGFIPQSGPHIAFVTLFASGIIPFPVLLANSISQDGHASLPLLAESRKAFFLAKAVKAVPAILIPLALLLF